MFDVFSSAIILVYAAMGLVALYAFVPTIRDLWLERSGVNSSTYLMWLCNSLVGTLYALFVVGDLTMFLLSFGWVLSCLVVLSLNWRYQRKQLVLASKISPDLTVNGESLGL